jgi:hypothetical protein
MIEGYIKTPRGRGTGCHDLPTHDWLMQAGHTEQILIAVGSSTATRRLENGTRQTRHFGFWKLLMLPCQPGLPMSATTACNGCQSAELSRLIDLLDKPP